MTNTNTSRKFSTKKSTAAAKQETIRRREVRKAKTFDYGKVSR